MASCQLNQVIGKLLISFQAFSLAILFSSSSYFHIFLNYVSKIRIEHTNLMFWGHSNVHDTLIKSQIAGSILIIDLVAGA